ncbi:MAG TPA: IS1182 family transposase [Mycobacterium sp.]|nr:IS1182 family transposase [Mycobacterium sp.]
MALGAGVVGQRFENPRELLGDRLRGIYRLLADEGDLMFPDDYFSDLYKDSRLGRPTVPARVLATVMVLQAHEGLSDGEACDRLECDLRWQAAAGVDAGYRAFHPTVLVGQRNRLRASARPKRLFEDTKVVAREAGHLKTRVRVLDSTPVYDAVSTQDTVTQLRSAIRKVLRVLQGRSLGARVRLALRRDDDYVSVGKPPCDWDDAEAREQLIDALVRDALAALAVLDGCVLDGPARDAAELLALVAGQDVECGDDGVFRIARRVAADRVISTVDPEARHGHKSHDRRFDGYKAHLSVDPDSELIDEVVVTPANAHDATAVDDLLAPVAGHEHKPTVMGDSAYAGADTLAHLHGEGFDDVKAKVPPARGRDGRFGKDDFDIDLEHNTVGCPAGQTAPIRFSADGGGIADFGQRCTTCPLRDRCTISASGRTVTVHPEEALLQRHKAAQADPEWQEAYRSTRPKVERKIAHFARVAWGGRKARTRGRQRVTTDAVTRAAAVNFARLATLGVRFVDGNWVAGTG